MAEKSSSLTTFRAFVMLFCVVLIPFAAVCGTSFPAVVKAIQSGRLPTLADFRGPGPADKSNLGEAPPFVPPAGMSNLNASAAQSAPPFSAAPNMGRSGPDVITASFNAPVGQASTGVNGQSTSFPQNRQSENRDFSGGTNPRLSAAPPGADGLIAVGNGSQSGESRGGGTRSLADRSQQSGDGQATPDAPFKHIQQRLRELGATYYLLETWGDQSEDYRFYCRMAVGGNRHVTKQFNWVAGDPLTAMSNVLQQVEDWQKGGVSTPVGLTGMSEQGTH